MDIKDYNKRVKLALMKQELLSGYQYNNHVFQVDEISRSNITGKALALQLDPTIGSINWITNSKDDKGLDIVYTFTREEFIKFAIEVHKYYEDMVFKYKDYNKEK